MALQEKEFVVKNGLDIKNNGLKLAGTAPLSNQIPVAANTSTSLVWKTLNVGSGISVTHSDSAITLSATATTPSDVNTNGNLTVGATATWTSNGTIATVTLNNHGLSNGTTIYIAWLTGTNKPVNNDYSITSTGLNTFTVVSATPADAVGGNCTTNGNITALRNISANGTGTFGTSLTLTGTPSIIAGTIGNTASVFNTTTGSLNIGTASPTIAIGNASSTTTFGNIITHKGLTLQVGTAGSQKVDTSYTFTTASLTLNTTWQASGITGSTQLMTGTYLFKLRDGANNEYFDGILPWYSGNGSASIADNYTEIPLRKFGDGSTGYSIFVRIFRTASAAPVIQLASTSALTAKTFTFTFRKMID